MIGTLSLALLAYLRVSPRFGWEELSGEVMNDDAFVHQHLTQRACEEYRRLAGRGPAAATPALKWHCDYVDSYLYSPVFWAGGLTEGDGFDRLKVSVSFRDELESVHFDDLTSTDQIDFMWTRYLSGCMAGMHWAAESNDPLAAQNILGVTLHAIQDFYAHSNWVDVKERRAEGWHRHRRSQTLGMNLYTGSYETPEHLSQRPHGRVSLECSLMQGSGLSSLMKLACSTLSPLNKLTPCQVYDRCKDARTVRTNVLGVQLPPGLVYLDPPGIALDSSWQAEIGRQLRDIPADDPITARELYTKAKDLAVATSVWWLAQVEKQMTTWGKATFWDRVWDTNGFDEAHSQYEDFSKVPFLFVGAGPYPPRAGDSPWDWYLRLQIRTSSTTDSGTNGEVSVRAPGYDWERLDHSKLSSAAVEYNDFSTGDVQTFVVGPYKRMPDSLTFRVEGADAGNVLGVIWDGFVGAVKSVIDSLGDLFLAIIGGGEDHVTRMTLQWSPEQLAGIGYEPVPFTAFLDGDDEGQYNVFGSITRSHDVAPHRRIVYDVRIDTLHCHEESVMDGLFTDSDEPVLMVAVINPAERVGGDRVQAFRTSPRPMDKGDRQPLDRTFKVQVPDGSGMLAIALSIYEHDSESLAQRERLFNEFIGATEEETQSWSDRFVETVGALFGSDWKLGGLRALAFNRAPSDARSAVVCDARHIEHWIDAGSSYQIALTPPARDDQWTTWSVPEVRMSWLLAHDARARELFAALRYDDSVAEVKQGMTMLTDVYSHHEEISFDDPETAAGEWLNLAAAAHPHDVPQQLAAAENAFSYTRLLIDRPLPDPRLPAEKLTRIAGALRRLVGLRTWGTPNAWPSEEPADWATRFVYPALPGDHRLEIAQIWQDLALRHHESGAHSECPDAAAEWARQREVAGQALDLAGPLVDELDGLHDEQRVQLGALLRWLVGLLSFGAAESGRSPEAAGLAARAFESVTASDRRIDVANVWHTLALRHHETGVHPDCLDRDGELTRQRAAAAAALSVAAPLVATLDRYDDRQLGVLGYVLWRLVGTLSFGAPESGESPQAAALAQQVYQAMSGDHRLTIAQVWKDLAVRHAETSGHPECLDRDRERTLGREAARRAMSAALPLAARLDAYDDRQRSQLATTFEQLVGLLTYGVAPGTAEADEAAGLAEKARGHAERIRASLAN